MTIKLPTLLAFERKLEISDGLMYSGEWKNIENNEAWSPIRVIKRANRSTQSAYGIEDSKKSEANPVASDNDDANLPMNHDTLRVSFTMRIIGNLGKPFACNVPAFQEAIIKAVNQFKETTGLSTLANRYAYNIANGRFLWRNRVCADKIKINVYLMENENETKLEFDGFSFPVNNFEKNSDNINLKTLGDYILKGFRDNEEHFGFLRIDAYAKLGIGQHVFPSQEMNMSEKRKTLFKINDCAAIHNVKLANAIRTIDNWYDENAQFPIAIEPYGSVTQIGQAFRKSKIDLYTLLLKWLNNEEISETDKAYIVANLIRGGLFQGESEKKKKED